MDWIGILDDGANVIALLDRQHYGTGRGLGAAADLDGDGLIEVHEREAMLTPLYITPAKRVFADNGHDATVISEGSYPLRHRVAATTAAINAPRPVAYIACHLNAGGTAGTGDYGVIFYDGRSAAGWALATAIAHRLRALDLDGVARILVRPTDPDGWTRRAHATISGIYRGPINISGVCFEPLFLDNPAHQAHLTEAGLSRIGEALALGCIDWARERGAP